MIKKILLSLGSPYFQKSRVGVGTYQSNIINGLKCEYDIVSPISHNAFLPENANEIHISKLKQKLISIFKWFLPVSVFYKDYDIVFTDSCAFIPTNKTKVITIVHDCMCFTEPQNYTWKAKLYAKIASSTFKKASKIIAVSNTTKQTLHDLFKIPYSKIFVIPNVTSFEIEHKQSNDFAFIGDMRKTKNLDSLIYGFSEYLKKYSSGENLIIAGRKKYEYESLLALVKKLGIENRVIFTGYISDEEKITLFENAKALILLSDNEGFGIPLIEAVSNKIPVLCSDIPVFNEILNENSAVFVDSKNISVIADGFHRVSELKVNQETANEIKNRYSSQMFNEKLEKLLEEL